MLGLRHRLKRLFLDQTARHEDRFGSKDARDKQLVSRVVTAALDPSGQ